MNNFLLLIRYEYRKIFQSKINLIFLGLAVVLAVVTVLGNAFGSSYYSEAGKDLSKPEALILDRETVNAHKGYADADMLKQAVLLAKKGAADRDAPYREDAYALYTLPYENLYHLIDEAFRETPPAPLAPVLTLDEETIDNFYSAYKDRLMDNAFQLPDLTKAEKLAHLDLLTQIKTPFWNEYIGGWETLRNLLPFMGNLILMAIALAASSVFGKEYACGTDALLLSSKSGRSVLISAKLAVVVSFSALVSLLILPLHLGSYLLTHGLGGAQAPLQFLSRFGLATYPLALGQAALISFAVLALTGISFGCFCALLSAACRNPLVSVSVAFLTIFVPSFFPSTGSRVLTQIFDLLWGRVPKYEVLFSCNFYTFGELSLPPYLFLGLFAVLTSVLFLLLARRSFQAHQVR